jgi:hypothetical protein
MIMLTHAPPDWRETRLPEIMSPLRKDECTMKAITFMMSCSQVTHAAVVQTAPIAFDRERTLEKVRALTADTASQRAQLVLFLEAFVPAYPRGDQDPFL